VDINFDEVLESVLAEGSHGEIFQVVPVEVSEEFVEELGEHDVVVPLENKCFDEGLAGVLFSVRDSDFVQEVLDNLDVEIEELVAVVELVALVQHDFVAEHKVLVVGDLVGLALEEQVRLVDVHLLNVLFSRFVVHISHCSSILTKKLVSLIILPTR